MEEDQKSEAEMVRENRYLEAQVAGMEHVDAERFADSDIDIGELRHLIEASCPADLLAAVLL